MAQHDPDEPDASVVGTDRAVAPARDVEQLRAIDFFHSSATAYEAKHYENAVRSFMTVRHSRVLDSLDRLQLSNQSQVLDAGCGPGFIVTALAQRGFSVVAADAAPAMLELTKRRIAAEGLLDRVRFAEANIEQLPFQNGQFDLVVSTGVIEYVKSDRTALLEFRRVLKPGGYLILPVTNALSPVNALDFIVEPLKRRPLIMRPFNAAWTRSGRTPILPREFQVRKHIPARICRELRAVGFRVREVGYFHFLPWPRPLDQLLPSLSNRIGSWMEGFSKSWLAPLGEGYLTISQLPCT